MKALYRQTEKQGVEIDEDFKWHIGPGIIVDTSESFYENLLQNFESGKRYLSVF